MVRENSRELWLREFSREIQRGRPTELECDRERCSYCTLYGFTSAKRDDQTHGVVLAGLCFTRL